MLAGGQTGDDEGAGQLDVVGVVVGQDQRLEPGRAQDLIPLLDATWVGELHRTWVRVWGSRTYSGSPGLV